ncbi:MAG: hypothetical protein RLZZ385_380 [Pseudomonadota bacterium]|jgi:2',3'-cyclic-nucleotide 2'-phosphodiesterase (5'-nucleotidase family)
MKNHALKLLSYQCPRLLRAWVVLGVFGLAACTPLVPTQELIVLYTNDEHGWMQGQEAGQGAAELLQLWREQEGYTERGPFLVLSGGDNWTGPAISTWTQGESMVEVMNAMGYDASAVGNHEFDFGLDVLQQRISESDFPYLSANTRWRRDGTLVTDIGVAPFTIEDVNGLRIGIIGLTTTSTPMTTLPSNVADLRFDEYETSLREWVPVVRGQDIDLLFVIAHVCVPAMEALIAQVEDLDIDLFGAGHCNELVARRVGDTILLGGGTAFGSYAKATLSYRRGQGQVEYLDLATVENRNAVPASDLARIIHRWHARIDSQTSRVIGHSDAAMAQDDPRLQQAIIDSWLQADPTADIAITNAGGIRAPMPAGDITVGTIVSILPFDNTIIAVEIAGGTVKQALLQGRNAVVAGLRREGEQWVLTGSGRVLDDNTRYRVLINNFMYEGGDGYGVFREADPNGFDTGINYRQPFLQWVEAQD